MNKDNILTKTLGLLVGLLLIALTIVIYKCYFTDNKSEIKQVVKTVTKYVPQASDTIYLTTPAKVDTEYVIRHYYSKVPYHDTIRVKDVATLSITDTVSQNALTGRTIEIEYTPKKIAEKNYRIGVSMLAGKQHLALMGEYQYNKLKIYGGYDLIQQASVAGIGFQLFNW